MENLYKKLILISPGALIKFTYKFLMNLHYLRNHLSELSHKKEYQTTRYNITFDLLLRIYSNVNAAYTIYGRRTTQIPEDVSLIKIPIDLSLRSATADSLLLLYLLSQNDIVLEEEVKILNKDFVKFSKTFLEIQHDWAINFLKTDVLQNATKSTYVFNRFHFDDYLKTKDIMPENWAFKTDNEFRSSKNPNSGKLTILNLFKYLNSSKDQILKECSYLYMNYKILSQIEHYTFFGRQYSKVMYDPSLYNIIAHLINLAVKKAISYLPYCDEKIKNMITSLDIMDYRQYDTHVPEQDESVMNLYKEVDYNGGHYRLEGINCLIKIKDKTFNIKDIFTIRKSDTCGVEIHASDIDSNILYIRVFALHQHDEYINNGKYFKDSIIKTQQLETIKMTLDTIS